MSLGFSVEALVPAARKGAALRMGLRRLSEADWLQPEFDRAARAEVFDAHPDAMQVLPGAEAACREVAALVGAGEDLAGAARGCWEDLCVLQSAGPDHPYRLTAGAVAFPTDWRLDEKMGLDVTQVHAPIHGYAEQLSAGVDHFLRTVAPGPIFARANWFVVASDAWRYLPASDPAAQFAHVTTANAGDTLFVRCERQTLRRLPDTGAVLFTIGVAVARLGSLGASLVRQIADALTVQPGGEQDRRGAPLYLPSLRGYADRMAATEFRKAS